MAEPMESYRGTDNLEVMAEAVRYNEFLLCLIHSAAPAGPGRVLDFGAGAGTFALPLAAQGLAVTCLEPDDHLRARLTAHGLPVLSSLHEVVPGAFGFIYSLNVLEHIEDDLQALRELRRCLVADGTLLIYVPAFQILYSSMDRKVGHFRRYRRNGLMALMHQAGFRIESARYVDSMGFLASLAYRFLGPDDGGLNRRGIMLYDRWILPLSLALDRILGRWLGKNLVVIATPATDR